MSNNVQGLSDLFLVQLSEFLYQTMIDEMMSLWEYINGATAKRQQHILNSRTIT